MPLLCCHDQEQHRRRIKAKANVKCDYYYLLSNLLIQFNKLIQNTLVGPFGYKFSMVNFLLVSNSELIQIYLLYMDK